MGMEDARRLLHDRLGWSWEVHRLEDALAQPARHSPAAVREAAREVLAILPDDGTCRPYRAAVARLVPTAVGTGTPRR
jgi:hypothetical protein